MNDLRWDNDQGSLGSIRRIYVQDGFRRASVGCISIVKMKRLASYIILVTGERCLPKNCVPERVLGLRSNSTMQGKECSWGLKELDVGAERKKTYSFTKIREVRKRIGYSRNWTGPPSHIAHLMLSECDNQLHQVPIEKTTSIYFVHN